MAKKRNHVWQPTAKIMALLLPLEAEAIQVPAAAAAAAAALLALGPRACVALGARAVRRPVVYRDAQAFKMKVLLTIIHSSLLY